MPAPIPNFPGVGPIGYFSLMDGVSSNAPAAVDAANGLWISGPVLVSILAELRVQSGLLQTIANTFDNLQQLRADAVADMGTIYTAPFATPIQSS